MASHNSIGSSSRSRSKQTSSSQWADEVDDVHDLQHLVMEKETRICELEYELDMMKDKVKRLKANKEKLVEEVEEMGIATTETMFELKKNNNDKRLMLTLVFSWAFYTLVLFMK
uniref:Uncharacterized protein n=1 Tax=Chenopodium quinoa TaxID=63459 RepID=A0A803N2H7_CHEQI